MKALKSEKSYAKINLHLHIGGKREDGYHPLSSIFHLIELHDVIKVELTEQQQTHIEIIGMDGVPLTQNIMYKAASLFLTTINAHAKVLIHIDKNIPMQGGLGGGSSNAATVLLILQQIYHYPIESSQLYSLGLMLGSDVPFFLHQECVAYVEGRGEVITPMKARDDLAVVLTFPINFGVSTKQAFHDLDTSRGAHWKEPLIISSSKLCHMYSIPVKEWRFYNDFKNIIIKYNNLNDILSTSEIKGSNWYSSISGSGSTIFTVTDSGDEYMIYRLFEEKYRTQVTNTLTKCMYLL